MALGDLAYPTLVYIHLLLFVLWLGADVGVFLLGQHFRKRHAYSLDQRIALLKLLVIVDLVPRSAWALMVPVSLSVVDAGNWWDIHPIGLIAAWAVSAIWLWLIFDAHCHDQTPRAARDRQNENFLKLVLVAFYLWLGIQSLLIGEPLGPTWLALKALAFGLIFLAAIMIDVSFKPVGPQLVRLLNEGSSDETEIPLRRTMDRTRIWVWV
ncbi:MAG TPA: hypothetical protein VK391_01405, partial [Allosphingosinicella sp.]|nr:hypothetical protein [Allosphingosinicella sp.]